MAYEGLTAHIPAGLLGLNADENRLQRPVGSLVEAEGLVFEDGLLAKEPGARRIAALASPAPISCGFVGGLEHYGAIAVGQITSAADLTPVYIGAAITERGLPVPGDLTSVHSIPTALPLLKGDIVILTIARRSIQETSEARVLTLDGEDVTPFARSATVWATPSSLNVAGLTAWVLTAPRDLPAGVPIVVRVNSGTFFGRPVPMPGAQFRIQARVFRNLYSASPAATFATASDAQFLAPTLQTGVFPQLIFLGGITSGTAAQEMTVPFGFTHPVSNGPSTPAAPDNLLDPVSYSSWFSNTSPYGRIVGLLDWWGTPGAHHIITVAEKGTVSLSAPIVNGALPVSGSALVIGDTGTPVKTARLVPAGLEAAGRPRRVFLFADGAIPGVFPRTPVGSTTPTVPPAFAGAGDSSFWPDAPADWARLGSATLPADNSPINGTVVANRLAAWGNKNFPHAVYLSTPSDHTDFRTAQGALVLSTNSQVGERLYGGVNFQGLLVLWKFPRGIFLLDPSEPDTARWRIETKSEGLGCAPSPHAVLPLDDDVLFLAADGTFHLLSAIDTPFGLQSSDLGSLLNINKWVREHVNLQALDRVTSVWYSHKRTAYFALPPTGATQCQLLLKFDFNARDREGDGAGVKVSYSYRDTGDALALFRPVTSDYERPILGDAGVIYELDYGALSLKDNQPYVFRYRTPPLDMASVAPELRDTRKNWQFVEFVLEPAGDPGSTLTVDVYLDGRKTQTLAIPTTERRVRRRLTGSSYDIAFGVTGTHASSAKVLEHIIQFERAGEGPH